MQSGHQAGLDPLLDGILVEGVAEPIGGLLVGETERPDVLPKADGARSLADVGRSDAQGRPI
eukprot:15153663-Alexandrium_andersonii.AAC.1